MENISFKVGQTYSTRSACDYDCVFTFPIIARTAKSITTIVRGVQVRRGVKTYNGIERCKPMGSYSMAPQISADRLDD